MVLKKEYVGVELKFYNLCKAVVEEQGLDLYDLDYERGTQVLRLFVMDLSTGSALIDDCVKVDRAMTEHVETEEWMPAELVLEVSSPGLYRQLNSVEHFEGVVGKDVNLAVRKNISEDLFPGAPKGLKGNKKFIARLEAVKDSTLSFIFNDYKFDLNFEDIKKANLESEISKA